MPESQDCRLCHGSGWIFEVEEATSKGVKLYLLACPGPDCEFSGQPIFHLNVADANLSESSLEAGRLTVLSR